jgi:hypothetical protein
LENYKFGTWCPIDTLENFDNKILVTDGKRIEKAWAEEATEIMFSYYGPVRVYQIEPSHWMPLPPRPGEE